MEIETQLADLPENVRIHLVRFIDAAKTSCRDGLVSAVLFGSAAEGRLRPTSDVNLILVLREFRAAPIDGLRESLRVAHAAIRLNVMFLTGEEIPAAMEAFAVKFTDILGRRRILFGSDPFAGSAIPRSATLIRLRQVLMNLTLRLRERYVLVSLREDRLPAIIAEFTGPVRASAATILQLEGGREIHPKEALQALSGKLRGGPWDVLLESLSTARQEQAFRPGEAAASVLGLLDLLQSMRVYARNLE